MDGWIDGGREGGTDRWGGRSGDRKGWQTDVHPVTKMKVGFTSQFLISTASWSCSQSHPSQTLPTHLLPSLTRTLQGHHQSLWGSICLQDPEISLATFFYYPCVFIYLTVYNLTVSKVMPIWCQFHCLDNSWKMAGCVCPECRWLNSRRGRPHGVFWGDETLRCRCPTQ